MIAADELGPVMPRTFDPPAGWSPDGHRVKAPLTYSRGPDKTWIYGGLRIGDGQAVTLCAPSRNSAHGTIDVASIRSGSGTPPIKICQTDPSAPYPTSVVSCGSAGGSPWR